MLIGPAVVALLVYVLGIPAFVFLLLRGRRERIKYSQILRAKGLHTDRLVQRYWVWSETWSRLFYFYVPLVDVGLCLQLPMSGNM